ncbi:MAG: hypothetical protein ACLR7U_11615 [Ruthenibacterium lactatiformans]
MLQVVEDELNAMREKYGDDRRTEIAMSPAKWILRIIPEEESVFTLTHAGYIKRQPSDTYQAQRRGAAASQPCPARMKILWKSCSLPLRMTISCL